MKLFNKFPVFLIIVCLLFFWPFLLKGRIPIPADTIVGIYHPWRDLIWNDFKAGVPFKNPLITDPVRQQFIWKKLAIDQFRKFDWPLWNPYTHAGMPLLANFQTGAFYPFNLLFFLFDFKTTWGVYIFLQPLLGSLFMFAFLRCLKLTNVASFFGAVVFAFCGFNVAWMEWGNIGHTFLWLPLVLLSIEKIITDPLKKWRLVFVFSLVFCFFAGHLQTSFYVILFSFLYLFFRLFSLKKKKLKILLLFIICYLLFIAITSIQWLPTLQLILNSTREIDQGQVLQRSNWFLPSKHLIQLIVPDFFGNPTTANYWGEWNYGEFVGFIGVVPLFLVFLSLFEFKKSKLIKFFSILCLFFLSFALPTPWAKIPFLWKIPFLSSAQPSRLICLADFSLVVLAAFGLDRFIVNRENKNLIKQTTLSLMLLFFLFVGLWLFVFYPTLLFPQSDWFEHLSVSVRNLIFPTLIFLATTALVIFCFLFRKKKVFRLAILAVFLIAIFDFYRFFGKFIPFSSEEWIFPKTQSISFLQKQTDGRVMSIDRRLMPANFGAAYQLETISGYDPLYLRDYARLITEIESGYKEEIAPFNRIVEPANFSSSIIDDLNVAYILSLTKLDSRKLREVFQEGETFVYKNLNVFPRLRFNGQAEIISYQPSEVKIKTKSYQKGDLVLADMFYPGWQVKVNGERKKLEQTEYNFRRVVLDKGENIVEFIYFPGIFRFGLILSLTGGLFFAGYVYKCCFSKRK